MEKQSVTDAVIEYIRKNHISVTQTATDLHIPESRLQTMEGEALTASEFLALCEYLGVRPEYFR